MLRTLQPVDRFLPERVRAVARLLDVSLAPATVEETLRPAVTGRDAVRLASGRIRVAGCAEDPQRVWLEILCWGVRRERVEEALSTADLLFASGASFRPVEASLALYDAHMAKLVAAPRGLRLSLGTVCVQLGLAGGFLGARLLERRGESDLAAFGVLLLGVALGGLFAGLLGKRGQLPERSLQSVTQSREPARTDKP